MKKIMSVIMIAIMAICSSIVLSSCGDDDDDEISTTPIVKTQDCVVKGSFATIYGLVDWNGNTKHKELGFDVYSKNQPTRYSFKVSNNKESFSTDIQFNIKGPDGNPMEYYKQGDVVYYQAVAYNCIINGTSQDVKGELKSFIVE